MDPARAKIEARQKKASEDGIAKADAALKSAKAILAQSGASGIKGYSSASAPAPSPTLYQSAKAAYHTVAVAANQVVSELTPDILSANVGRRCGQSSDPDCGCKVWRESCAANPLVPACRSTGVSMCPGMQ